MTSSPPIHTTQPEQVTEELPAQQASEQPAGPQSGLLVVDQSPNEGAGQTSGQLKDKHGREVSYLRLSVTDRCNLRCRYCWSCENMRFIPHENILSYEEMLTLIDIAANMGVQKIRLTGGEPFVRKGFLWFLEQIITRHPNIDVRITSNATMLADKVAALAELGVKCLNISLDTFNQTKFREITGRDMLRNVTRAIDTILQHNIRLKINAVAMKGINDDELPIFINFARRNPVDVRFIEFMPMGDCTRWDSASYWPAPEILEAAKRHVTLTPLGPGERKSGPAKLFGIEGGLGRIGLITPLSNHFCNSCNRLRITPDGKLRTCLFSDKEFNLRTMLRSPDISNEKISEFIRAATNDKPLGYKLLAEHKGTAVAEKRMSAIGG